MDTTRRRYENVELNESEEADVSANSSSRAKSNIHMVPPAYGLILVSFICTLFILVFYLDSYLPAPLYIKDEKTNPDAFIAERSRDTLKLLTDMGPRIVGSVQNEVLAVTVLKDKINDIQKQANKVHKIEIDQQLVSGNYYLEYKPNGFANVYRNVQNLIVKLHGSNSNSSLLINAHFDSVPTSPGASDDGIMCAIMVEVLRKISQMDKRPKNNIIFLFNGAEETILQASHGFITQHEWAKEAKVLINLEACGNGGKEILFQTGPKSAWLLKYYKQVPYPYGQAAGEEIFQSNIIPSDTDFRIFRDYGNLIGFDFAFARDGYRYHTKYDRFDNIPLGSYQHAGSNILKLVKELMNAPEVENPKSYGNESAVYYDVLGYFIVTYSQFFGLILNLVVGCLSIIIAFISFINFGLRINWRGFKIMLVSLISLVLGWILSAGFIYSLSFILDKINFTMSWYAKPWLLFGLYCAPVAAICIFFNNMFNNFYRKINTFSVSIQVQIQIHIVRLIWTAVLLVGTCYSIRSVYAIMIPVLFNTLYFIVIKICNLQHSVRKWQTLYLLSTVIPTMMIMYQALLVMTLFIPITGRMGSDKNPDLIIGALAGALTILITSYFVPLINLVRRPTMITLGLIMVFILTFVLILTPFGFPYSGNYKSPAPQRFMIYHTNRIMRNETNDIIDKNSGIFIFNMDKNSVRTVKRYFSDGKSIKKDCEDYICCGFPISSPRMVSIMQESSVWLPFDEAEITEYASLEMTSKVELSEKVTRFNFKVAGPDHMNIYIQPRFKHSVIRTSLTNFTTENLLFVNLISGLQKVDLEFYIDVSKPDSYKGSLINIAISEKYVHENSMNKTDDFRRFCEGFPDWADVTAAVASFQSFVF